jgi:hypothetical protein
MIYPSNRARHVRVTATTKDIRGQGWGQCADELAALAKTI